MLCIPFCWCLVLASLCPSRILLLKGYGQASSVDFFVSLSKKLGMTSLGSDCLQIHLQLCLPAQPCLLEHCSN